MTTLNGKIYGQIIYATPGSGKTYLANNYRDIIDGDDLILEAISMISPGFQPDYQTDSRKNIFKYMKYVNYAHRKTYEMYDTTKDIINDRIDDETIILIGSVKLMYLADLVYIQQNADIVRDGFNRESELAEVNRLQLGRDTIRFMNNYLENYLTLSY